MLPTSSSSPSSVMYYTFPILLCHVLCYFSSTCFSASSASSSGLLLLLTPPTTFSSSFPPHPAPPPSLPLCSPFPSTHQSLALASPLRTYGMMDRRASGASKAKGHLPGALHCRGALGPAMQPRPHTSVSRHSHSHTRHAHSNTYYRIGYLTLAPLTLIAASHHVQGFVFLMIVRDKYVKERKIERKDERMKMQMRWLQITYVHTLFKRNNSVPLNILHYEMNTKHNKNGKK